MKAAVLYGKNDLRFTEYDTPVTLPGTVKVRVRAAGICGSDVPRVLGNEARYYPIVLGHEFSGDVVEVGQEVTHLQVGDTVSGVPLIPCMHCDDCQRGNFSLCKNYSFIGSRVQGGFSEYVVLPAQNAVRYDPCIPYIQAAMFEPSTVALHGLYCNEYRGGETVAVLGCGTIGVFAVQWARIMGGKRVVAFDIDDSRLALAKRLGADETINTAKGGYMEDVTEFTQGKGFAFVFEAAGHPDAMHTAFALAGNKAHVCFIGTPHTNLSFTPKEWEHMNRKEFKLTGSWMSYSAPFPGKEWELTAHYFATGQLKFDNALVYKTFSLQDAAEAFALFQNPSQVHGKIMLVNDLEECS